MKEHNKFTIAHRYKEDVKDNKKNITGCIFISAVCAVMAIAMLFIKTQESTASMRFIPFGIFLAIGIFIVCLIPMLKKNKANTIKVNSYPEEAIFFDNGDICIQTDEVIKIKREDITKVSVVHKIQINVVGPIRQRTTFPDGSVIITTKEKKYTISQLRNIESVKKLILRLKDAKTLLVNDTTLFVYDGKKTDIYVANLQLDGISVKITIDANEDTLEESTSTACKIIKGFTNFHKKVLEATAEQLTPLANKLNKEYFPAEQDFTTEEFINAIKNNLIYIAVNKNRFNVIWEDDGELFFGHSILCEGNIDNNEIKATYAG